MFNTHTEIVYTPAKFTADGTPIISTAERAAKATVAYKSYRLNFIRPVPEAEAIEEQSDGRILFKIPDQKYDTRISVSQNYIVARMREAL